eukprot:scaffold29789_cov36-Cyclotella_meneghiniana.AAC.1
MATPSDMEEIASLLSIQTSASDAIFLDGDLGAGKTCFSRGFIRSQSGYTGRITSPTSTVNDEQTQRQQQQFKLIGTVGSSPVDHEHSQQQQLIPLDVVNVFQKGVALVEWPERLHANSAPMSRLEVTLTIDSSPDNTTTTDNIDNTTNNDNGEEDDKRNRIMRLVPYGERWVERLQFYESQGYFDDLIIRQ